MSVHYPDAAFALRKPGQPFTVPVRVRKSHPLAKFLSLAYCPAYNGHVNLVTGRRASSDSVRMVADSRYGRAGWQETSSGTAAEFETLDALGLRSGAMSVFALHRMVNGGVDHAIFSGLGASSGWELLNSSTSAIRVHRAFVGYSSNFSDGTGITDKWKSTGLSWTTGGNGKGYYNAVETDLGTMSVNDPGASTTLKISRTTNTAGACGVWVAVAYAFKGILLTKAQHSALHEDPWQLLEPAGIEDVVGQLLAAGGTTVSLAGLATALAALAGGQGITRLPKGTAAALAAGAANQNLTRAIAGTAALRGDGLAAATRPIAGTASGQGGGAAAQDIARGLAGTAAGQGRAAAAQDIARALAGTGGAIGTGAAAPSIARALAGTAAARGAGAAPLGVVRNLFAAAFGLAAGSAPNPTVVTVALSALATAFGRGAAALAVQRDLAGAATGGAAAAGAPDLTRSLAGRAAAAARGAAASTLSRLLAGLATALGRLAGTVTASEPGAIPRTGGAVTMGGGSDGVADARGSSGAAVARASGTPAVPR